MAKLPHRPDVERLRQLTPETETLQAGSRLWRVYFRDGPFPSSWETFRHYGPVDARFDHHLRDEEGAAFEQEAGIYYAAGSPITAVAETFQRTRLINRHRNQPWLVGFDTQASLRLLDLTGSFPTRAGASMALMSGPRSTACRWAQAFHSVYPQVQGVLYPSSMHANRNAYALNERAEQTHFRHRRPVFHRALGDPAILNVMESIATELGYGLL